MAINLKNFVDIKINYSPTNYPSADRDTAVLIVNGLADAEKDYDSLDDFEKDYSNIKYYGYCFFKNGGRNLKVIQVNKSGGGETPSALTSTDIEKVIEKLDNKYIVIASTAENTEMVKVCPDQETDTNEKSISSKILLTYLKQDTDDADNKCAKLKTKINELKTETVQSETVSRNIYDGFTVKYGQPGIEMTIAAYLTNINADKSNSIQDYDFTIENVILKETNDSGEEPTTVTISSVCTDNSIVELLMENHINVDGDLVNQVRNIGGDDFNGNDVVNEFMLILLHQTLTDKLVNVLTQKIKYNQSGLTLIGTAISSELQRYVSNGYLSTDKIWDKEDLISETGIVVIAKNTPLLEGYQYMIMPFNTLTPEDKRNHLLPKIYVIIADSYSIRKIEITGEVI